VDIEGSFLGGKADHSPPLSAEVKNTWRYTSTPPNIVTVIKTRRMRWEGHVARMGEGRGVYRVSVRRPEGKRPLERPRRRCEDKIKTDLRETGIDGANWIQLAQDGVHWRACVNTVMNLRVPKETGFFLQAE
jgi:hypothetical protein